MSAAQPTGDRAQILIVSDGLRDIDVAELIRRLEEHGIAATQIAGLSQIPIRALDDFPAPLIYPREPKLKGRGRSELAQLRSRAMHMKGKKP